MHFGHLRKKWNPKMLPYIFAEKKGIHIIDLNKTTEALQEAAAALKQIAKSGKKIMFVGTKKQAKEIVTECAKKSKHAICYRTLAGWNAYQLQYRSQERKEDAEHRKNAD